MKKLGKMENVTLLSVEVDFDIQYKTFYGSELRGVAHYRIGLKFYKVQFIYLDESDFKVAFYEGDFYNKHNKIPEDRLQREVLLALIRGEIEKYFARRDQINYFKRIRQEEEKERRRKEEEERQKKIELGEQLDIEKYLKREEV